MAASLKKPKAAAVLSGVKWCQDVRTVMLAVSVVQVIVAVLIGVLGAAQIGMCREDRFGDWGMVYGSFLFGCSAVTTAAVHGRHRRVALAAICASSVTCVVALGIDGMSYFCVDLRGGANRDTGTCRNHIDKLNSCQWMAKYREGSAHLQHDGGGMRLASLIFVVLHLALSVGIATTAFTEAGRIDLCQVEEALRELKDVNQLLSYRERARRNRILTQYVSQAKPEEGQNVGTKLMRFFGFGTEVEPVPVKDRKVKFVLPKDAPPSSQL